MLDKTDEVIALWAAQPTASSIMKEARARCKELKSLAQLCKEKGVDEWSVKKRVYHTMSQSNSNNNKQGNK